MIYLYLAVSLFIGIIIGWAVCAILGSGKIADLDAEITELLSTNQRLHTAIKKHIIDYDTLSAIAFGYKNDLESTRSESYRQSKEIDSLTKQLRKEVAE
jgi:hypothetical protein